MRSVTLAATIAALMMSASASVVGTNFNHVLNGTVPLTQTMLDSMYSQYRAEPRDQSLSRFVNTINHDRKTIFQSTVRSIIEHNSDPTNAWTKSLNEFSDMTHEEFVQYYNIVKAD